VIDAANHEIIKKITFEIKGIRAESIQPVGMAMTKDDKRVFISLGPSNLL